VGQATYTLQRLDLGVGQFVVHGDLAHLGFEPGDLVVAFAFFQDCSPPSARRATLAIETFVSRADARTSFLTQMWAFFRFSQSKWLGFSKEEGTKQ
jgi:hypothetical protein